MPALTRMRNGQLPCLDRRPQLAPCQLVIQPVTLHHQWGMRKLCGRARVSRLWCLGRHSARHANLRLLTPVQQLQAQTAYGMHAAALMPGSGQPR